jgi:3-hydroxyisobutyrate dehydrogenase
MKVGYAGLGNLGRSMAERLIEQGVDLTVWNRSPEKAEGLQAKVAPSPADLMSAVDACFVCVRDERAVEDLVYGPDGLLSGDCEGKIVIDCSTNNFFAPAEFHREFAHANVAYVEAPVLGSKMPARNGQLTVLVHAADDHVSCENSILFFSALRAHKVPAELHLFSTGGHGFGLGAPGTAGP